jgi:anti-anti-sigma regulatory factor
MTATMPVTMPASVLTITTIMGQAGPVVVLAGRADKSTSGRLLDELMSNLPVGVSTLTVDAGQFRFTHPVSDDDHLALRALVMAARLARSRGGKLTVLRPPMVFREMLVRTGEDKQMMLQD